MTDNQKAGIGCAILVGIMSIFVGIGYTFGAGWGFLWFGIFMIGGVIAYLMTDDSV